MASKKVLKKFSSYLQWTTYVLILKLDFVHIVYGDQNDSV